MVTEQLVRDLLPTVDNYDEIINAPDVHCTKYRTSQLWGNNFIKPVLIMMILYEQNVRESGYM